MILVHYSAEPLVFDPTWIYHEEPDEYKPTGLWLSVEGDDDWRTWCEEEDFHTDRLAHANEITLKPGSNVLIIDSIPKLDDFTARFCSRFGFTGHLRWEQVREMYDGLIIAPYQQERHLKFGWYYGWDCASGVIWNLSAVATVTARSVTSDPTLLTVGMECH